MTPQQLPLPIGWSRIPDFQTFSADGNHGAVRIVRRLAAEGGVPAVLHGPEGSGKTHLLQAAVRHAHQIGRGGAYLHLDSAAGLDPAVLDQTGDFALLALDACDGAFADRRWAEALLRLIDRRRLSQDGLLMASRTGPAQLPPRTLPDLRTRLCACTVFRLQPLTDAALRTALQRQAKARGLTLADGVANYLIQRLPRDLPKLMATLDCLDAASLSAQRRLTLPFVQQWLFATRDPAQSSARTRSD